MMTRDRLEKLAQDALDKAQTIADLAPADWPAFGLKTLEDAQKAIQTCLLTYEHAAKLARTLARVDRGSGFEWTVKIPEGMAIVPGFEQAFERLLADAIRHIEECG